MKSDFERENLKQRLLNGTFVLMTSSLLATAAHAQVARVESIQTAPLTIEAPYTHFSTLHPAIVTLQINEAAAVTASAPVPEGFNDPSGTQYTTLLRHNSTEALNGTGLTISAVGEAFVELEMQTARLQPYPANSYSYNVLLTITPQ